MNPRIRDWAGSQRGNRWGGPGVGPNCVVGHWWEGYQLDHHLPEVLGLVSRGEQAADPADEDLFGQVI